MLESDPPMDEFDAQEFLGFCVACDSYDRIDSTGHCGECASKLERDLIRQRDWDYSWTAYGTPPELREKLRAEVIARHGAPLELLLETTADRKRRGRGGGRRRRKRKRRPGHGKK